jgi:hypothetical protein
MSESQKNATRFAPLPKDQLTDEQRSLPSVARALAAGTYNANGFDAVTLRNPGLEDAILAAVAKVYPLVAEYLGVAPGARPTVPQGFVEMGILLLAQHWSFPAMFGSHGPMAVAAGISQDIVDALSAGERPAHMRTDEAAVYDLFAELIGKHSVSDATFANVRSHLSEREVVDLVTSVGLYTNTIMLMKVANSNVH